MSAALISASILAVLLCSATAEPPLGVVGEGLLSKPFPGNGPPGKGVRYTGPVVYSNEKPPIIFFPPPPKDAKPGLGLFGKNKPKSIKYVPMPHHDLPVLIYTSDKMPPIHVVQPSNIEGPSPFGPPVEEFRPPAGSLSSTYRGIHPEVTSARIVTSSYEIPSTSYGSPVPAFGSSLGSLDLSPTGSIKTVENSERKPEHASVVGFRPPPPPPVTESIPNYHQRPGFGSIGPYKNAPPNILYNGQPPVHVFNEPDMFVQAPREIPVKTYADIPPKASFGPPKTSFGPPSINAFGPPPPHRFPHPHLTSFGPPSYLPPRENLIPSPSSLNPSTIVPSSLNPSTVVSSSPNDTPKAESNHVPVSHTTSHAPTPSQGGPPPPTYQFNPPQSMFSFGPFSIEYGPPSEPFMSFSEPTGSLSSFYGNMNNVPSSSNVNAVNVVEQENWIPGPPPKLQDEQIQHDAYDAPMPPPLPSYRPHLRSPAMFHGPRPNPMHSSVLLPSGPPKSVFGGYNLAHLLSAFKLKRSKPKYAIAPKSMQKPPIIIYYGKKPPIHVYQKPDEDQSIQTSAASQSTVTVISPGALSLDGRSVSNDNNVASKDTAKTTSAETVDLTYGSSQKTEIRVAAPPVRAAPERVEESPVIIPAKPVDIFPSAELQPSVYMARNSLNTIMVSDLSGSGTETIKTYIVRGSDDSLDSDARFSVGRQGDTGIMVSEDALVEAAEDNGDSSGSSSNDMPPTIVLAVGTPKQEEAEELQSEAAEPTVAVIQSPSSFQTSLSQAEKDAEEAIEPSSF